MAVRDETPKVGVYIDFENVCNLND